MKIPIPNILSITVLREICGDRSIYLSRIMERTGLFRFMWFITVCTAVCLAFKLLGYNCKLHTFFRGDMDRELHDHPWPFWTLVICGGYHEEIPPEQFREGMNWKREDESPFYPVQNAYGHQFAWREVGDLDYRPAKWRHRVVLGTQEDSSKPVPCVTLVFTKTKEREWGFWTREGWIPWFRFVREKAEAEGC